MRFGSIILGPSGSGKTTLCQGLQQFYAQIDRKVALINLDPANETMMYKPDIDIRDLIDIEEVMEELKLGPNGALVYAIDFLEKNIEWLFKQLQQFESHYLIFDMPGQIELYLNNESMKKVLQQLKQQEIQLVSVGLFDSFFCYDEFNFISMCFQSLSAMINLELPHLNVLSKIDLIKQYGQLNNPLRYYIEANDLSYLIEMLQDENKFKQKYLRLNQQLCNLIENFNMVGFVPLCVNDKISISNLISNMDKANGYFYDSMRSNEKLSDIRDAVFGNEINYTDMLISLEEEFTDYDQQEQDLLKDIEEYNKLKQI